MFNSILVQVGAFAGALICLTALIIGTWRERVGALFCLVTCGFYLISERFWPLAPAWSYLLVNGLCFVGLYRLCWKAPHPWPLWVTGFALISVMADILALTNTHILRSTLRLILTMSSYGLLSSLAIGTFVVWKQQKRSKESPKLGIFSYE